MNFIRFHKLIYRFKLNRSRNIWFQALPVKIKILLYTFMRGAV